MNCSFNHSVCLTLYQWKQWLMFWSISRVQCSTWQWTWWIIRQHTDVMKYGRDSTSVIKLVRSVWAHLSRQLRNRNTQQTGKCHATNTETTTARHLWFNHSYTFSVGDALFVAWYNLLQSRYWTYHFFQTCWKIDVYVDAYKMGALSNLLMWRPGSYQDVSDSLPDLCSIFPSYCVRMYI